jgi:hypothetical protein
MKFMKNQFSAMKNAAQTIGACHEKCSQIFKRRAKRRLLTNSSAIGD